MKRGAFWRPRARAGPRRVLPSIRPALLGRRSLPARIAALALLALALSGQSILSRGDVEVVHWPGDAGIARRALNAATRPLRLPGIGDSVPPPAARIVLAPSPQAFDSITRGAPHWAAGIAAPAERLIVLPAYPSARTPMGDPLTALRHEQIHLQLHAYLDGSVPRWFDEGYSTWASGEWDPRRGWEIRLGMLRGRTPPLDSLRLGWPGGEGDARMAYLLSASAVSYLYERGGEPAFRAFFERWVLGGDFDDALRGTYGLTLTQYEREWRAMVTRRYGWLLILSQAGIVWALVAVLLVLLTGPRRRRNREKLRQMEIQEWAEEWKGEV